MLERFPSEPWRAQLRLVPKIMLTRTTSRSWGYPNTKIAFLSLVAVLLFAIVGCGNEPVGGVFKESNNTAWKIPVEKQDDYLRVVVMFRNQSNDLERAKFFYYQMHKTPIGVRSVEKPGRFFQVLAGKKQDLYVPSSQFVEQYLFLMQIPLPREKGEDVAWSQWKLWQCRSGDISIDSVLKIPAFVDLEPADADAERVKLKKSLLQIFENDWKEAQVRMNTPVKPGDTVPWYAR